MVSDPKPLTIPESIELAKRFLGIPYLWGGRSSFGFDCSGFTQMLLRARGVNMPRDADQQAAWTGVAASRAQRSSAGRPAVLRFRTENITHTGMYIGDGQFIHAPTNGHPGSADQSPRRYPVVELLVPAAARNELGSGKSTLHALH